MEEKECVVGLLVAVIQTTEWSLRSLAFGVITGARKWPHLFRVVIARILIVVVIAVTKAGTIQNPNDSE